MYRNGKDIEFKDKELEVIVDQVLDLIKDLTLEQVLDILSYVKTKVCSTSKDWL